MRFLRNAFMGLITVLMLLVIPIHANAEDDVA